MASCKLNPCISRNQTSCMQSLSRLNMSLVTCWSQTCHTKYKVQVHKHKMLSEVNYACLMKFIRKKKESYMPYQMSNAKFYVNKLIGDYSNEIKCKSSC